MARAEPHCGMEKGKRNAMQSGYAVPKRGVRYLAGKELSLDTRYARVEGWAESPARIISRRQ